MSAHNLIYHCNFCRFEELVESVICLTSLSIVLKNYMSLHLLNEWTNRYLSGAQQSPKKGKDTHPIHSPGLFQIYVWQDH